MNDAKSLEGEKWAWACFYMGLIATAFGSSFYHLKPNDPRLVWDRLPVSSFLQILIIHYIYTKDLNC